MAAKTLAAAEAARLDECERVIAAGVDTFMSVGNALLEIRDSKLYRATHKSFDAYRQERWGIGKSRAYQLIDHAKAVEAISEASGETSTTVDISERETRAIKADLPAVVEDIKARREAGEAPEDAAKNAIEAKRREREEAAKKRASEAADRAEKTAEAKRQREAEQAENERQRQEAASGFSEAIKAREAAKNDAIAKRRAAGAEAADDGDLDDGDRVAELEEEVRALEAEVNRLKANLSEDEELERMRSEWRAGGWDKVIEKMTADHAFDVGVLKRQVETESADKASWAKSAKLWRRRAEQLGYSNVEEIDLSEGDRG